jgi:hypothetical protein
MEGYPKAAAKFCREANLQPQQPDTSIQTRRDVQHAIHSGNIARAISALNELDPEVGASFSIFATPFAMIRTRVSTCTTHRLRPKMRHNHFFMSNTKPCPPCLRCNFLAVLMLTRHQLLDSDPKLHFSLLRLQLVELIREANGGDPTAAITFATENLGPRAAAHRDFLGDLEETMLLIFYPLDKLKPELAKLLSPDLRRNTAAQVNEAMLLRQNQRREAAIRQLVRMRAWAETSARSQKKDLPESIELGLNGDNAESGESGLEPMITT